MAYEQIVNLARTTVDTGYVSGSGVLDVASTGVPFADADDGPFSIVLKNGSGGSSKTVLRVTAKNSGTQWAVTPESDDDDAADSCEVWGSVLSALALDNIRSNISQRGPFSSLPTSGMKDGDKYYPDKPCPFEYRFDGSIWRARYRGMEVTPPVISDFSTLGSTSGNTVTDTNGVLTVQLPGDNTDFFRGYTETMGSGPWTRIYLLNGFCVAGETRFGVLMRESSTGKVVNFMNYDATRMVVDRWNSLTSYSTQPLALAFNQQSFNQAQYWKLYHDGTNLHFYMGPDLSDFVEMYTEAKAAFFTTEPNEVGFGAITSGGVKNSIITLIHAE